MIERDSGGTFLGEFFNVASGGELIIGADSTGASVGAAITLDGGWPALTATAPLIVSSGDCTIGEQVTIQNNNNTTSSPISAGGGGVRIAGGNFWLYGKIKNNQTALSGGGVLFSNGNFTMYWPALIGGNLATTGQGGGVYMSNAATLFQMNGGTIGGDALLSNTSSGSGGGGVYLNSGTFQMDDGDISYNIAGPSTADGGGVFIGGSNIFTMTKGTISYNSATNNGGGVYLGAYGATFTTTVGSTPAEAMAAVFSNTSSSISPPEDNVYIVNGSQVNIHTDPPYNTVGIFW
jgi:hypothetical protein